MLRSLRFLSSALIAGVVLTTVPAEARFGKRSAPEAPAREDKPREEEPREEVHDATPVEEEPEHAASPVPRPAPSRPPERPERPERPSRREHRPGPSRGYYTEPESSYTEVYAPESVPAPAYELPAAPVYGSAEYMSRRSKNFLFGVEGQMLREGRATGFHLGVEGEEVGASLRWTGLTLRTDDGRPGEDEISVVGLHLSWAMLKGPSGRLRLEGGLSVARAPDITFVGPSMGLSSELYLLDSLALEGRVLVTPVPYRQLDAAGGAVWYVLGNVIAVRAGLRMLVLDDAGEVDGVVHRDVFPGPYASIGLAL